MIKQTIQNKRIWAFLLMILTLFELMVSAFSITANAEGIGYTNVLTDLQKDKNFNIEDYPAAPDDVSLDVIHIAEGENGELFIYVYQPCDATKDYRAKYINMSLQNPTNKSLEYKLYSLTWLNSNGVFDKYIVNGFNVTNDVERYYNISTIYRPYDETIDEYPEAIDSLQCKGYEVGQYWRAYYYNNVLFYEAKNIETVDIEIRATGSLRYPEGWEFGELHIDRCDSHYVAFSIENFDVEQIYDADITYIEDKYNFAEVMTPYSYKEEHVASKYVPRDYLSSKETGSNDGSGWFGRKYTWFRIQDKDTFIKQARDDLNHEFSQTEMEGLNQSQYVFRFVETEYSETWAIDASSRFGHFSKCEEIGVLRLHFLSDGKIYNLGCVSDLVGTDSIPEMEGNLMTNVENMEMWEILFALLCFIIVLLILSFFVGPLKVFFSVIWNGIKFIFEMLWAIITLPIQLIQQVFAKDKPHRKRKRK